MVTTVYLVRHCETEGNRAGIFQGATDTPLSPKGIFQLGLLSARLRGEKIDKIYTSPQPRARKTADSINAFHQVPIQADERLAEMMVGDMDGMDCTLIAAKFPQAAGQWNDAPWDFASPGGETMRQVFDRAALAFDQMVADNPGKTLLVTAHGCLLRNLLCYCKGLPIQGLADIPLGGNTAVSLVQVGEGGKITVKLLSDCSHLPPEMYRGRKPFRL